MPGKPKVCKVCGKSSIHAKGRCKTCYEWQRRHGNDRPEWRYNPKSRKCVVCGSPNPIAHKRCPACYVYWKQSGRDRSKALIERTELKKHGKKRCGRCGEVKSLSGFHHTITDSKGYQSECKDCQKEYGVQWRKENYVPSKPQQIVCDFCGKVFTASVAAPWSRFCSKYCSHRFWVENNIERRREHKENRRARKMSAFVAPVDRQEIFERDNWICGICGEPIDSQLEFPHPMSVTLDHIVPLAKNGTHEPENVQAAHFKCNCSKGSKVVGLSL